MFLKSFRRFPIATFRNSIRSTAQYVEERNIMEFPVKQKRSIELDFSYKVLQESAKPYNILSKQFNEINHDELIEQFGSTIRNGTDEKLQNVTIFLNSLNLLTDQQLLEVLRQLALSQVNAKHLEITDYGKIWKILDTQCCNRLSAWNEEQILLFSDAWYRLNLHRRSTFMKRALFKLGRNVYQITPQNLVQLAFLCNATLLPIDEMIDIQYKLHKCMDELTLKEIGVVVNALYRLRTEVIRSDLIERLYERLCNELETVEHVTLTSILKILGKKSKAEHEPSMIRLLNAIQPKINSLPTVVLMRIGMLGGALNIYNDAVLEAILQRYEESLPTIRLKDIERISLSLVLFNYKSPTQVDKQLCDKLPAELRSRMDEAFKEPLCFTRCLYNLILLDVCDMELLKLAFRQDFVDCAIKRKQLGMEHFFLDSYIKINLIGRYNGEQFSHEQRIDMAKAQITYLPSSTQALTLSDEILVELQSSLQALEIQSELKYILPQYDCPDLVICYDEQYRRSRPLSSCCPHLNSRTILTRQHLLGERNASHITTVAVVLAGPLNFHRHTLIFDMKLKQLQLLGHIPVVIYSYEWNSKMLLIKQKIFWQRKLAAIIKI